MEGIKKMGFNNEYPVQLKIELVRQYLNGKKAKEITKENGVAKSTLWGWTQKYQNLILKEREVDGIEINDDCQFVDIRKAAESVINASVVKTSQEIVKIFKNGMTIVCHIKNLQSVLRMINND